MDSGDPDKKAISPSWKDLPPHIKYGELKQAIREWHEQKGNVHMNEYRGLRSVLLSREELLARVHNNYATHRSRFERAMDGYKIQAIELLEEHIQRIRDNAPELVLVSLPMPEDHSSDYERVIEMLEWSDDEKLELNEQEFATYVLDQWGWQEGFGQTYAMYSGA